MLTKSKKLFVFSALILFAFFLTACSQKALSFVGGEGATGTAPQTAKVNEGNQYTIPENTFTKDGYAFVCWTDGTNDYKPGDVYTVGASAVTFTAKWAQVPTALAIEGELVSVGTNGTTVGGFPIELAVTATPADASADVDWASSNKNVATVDANGVVTPVSPGKSTITAKSKYAPTVVATFEVVIWPSEADNDVLLAADKQVKASIPEYIDGDFDFDLLYEDLITYEFKSVSDGTVYENGTYVYNLASDAFDTSDVIACTITYKGQELKAMYSIKIVGNSESNDYTELEYAEEKINELFEQFADDAKVTENFNLPLTLEGHDNISIQWTSSNITVLNVKEVEPADDTEVITHSICEYVRPNDDTEVTLTATVGITHSKLVEKEGEEPAYENVISNGKTISKTVKANGYSKEEKIAAIKAEVVPTNVTDGVLEMANVTLPLTDSKFMSTITWTSSDETKLSNTGKFLADADTTVTLSMKITYASAITAYSFEETVEFPINLNLSDDSAVVAAFRYQNTAEFETLQQQVSYFPYGKAGRTDNTMTLPSAFTVNGTNATVTWTCSEAGLFNETWELQKQYLRYHLVTLTATVKVGNDTATFEMPCNVGVSQLAQTSHIAGCFSRLSQQATTKDLMVCMDAMPIMSAFDAAVGNMSGSKYKGAYYCPINLVTDDEGNQSIYVGSNTVATTNSTYIGNHGSLGVGQTGGFLGLTYYYDFTNEETSEVTRFQYYFSEAFTWVVTDERVDANGDLQLLKDEKAFLSAAGRQHQQYGYIAIVNESTKDVKIPVFAYSTSNPDYPKDINGSSNRDASISYDANEWGFIMDKDGKIIFGGEDISDQNLTYVTIPAGGILWNAGGGQTDSFSSLVNTYFLEYVTTVGNKVTLETWDVHPFNSIIEYFKNDVTLALPDDKGNPIVNNYWGY